MPWRMGLRIPTLPMPTPATTMAAVAMATTMALALAMATAVTATHHVTGPETGSQSQSLQRTEPHQESRQDLTYQVMAVTMLSLKWTVRINQQPMIWCAPAPNSASPKTPPVTSN